MGIADFLKFFLDIYNTTTVAVRFAYIYWIIFIVLYITFWYYDEYQKLQKPRETEEANYHGTLYLFGGIAILLHHGSLYAQWSFFSEMAQGTNVYWLGFIGFLIMGIGLYQVAAARMVLDGYWGPHIYKYPEGDNGKEGELKTAGIYRFCRHPVYSGQIFMTIGTVMLSNNWWVSVLPIGTAFFSIWRARVEERDLHKRFSDEWVSYKKKVSFIVPCLRGCRAH